MLQVFEIEVKENKMNLCNQLEKLNQVNYELKEKNSKLIEQRKLIER